MIRKIISWTKYWSDVITFYLCAAFIIAVLGVIVVTSEGDKHQVVSDREVQEIYNNLLMYTGVPSGMMPKLVIIHTDIVNAYADSSNNVIAIYTGMLKFCNSKGEVAAVLGHEMGHILMQHEILNPNNSPDVQTFLEGNADKFGSYLVLRSGYDICGGTSLWKRMRGEEGDYEINSDHPNYSYRAWELDFPECHK